MLVTPMDEVRLVGQGVVVRDRTTCGTYDFPLVQNVSQLEADR